MLALIFGIRVAFVSYSLVLLLQSLLFGAGGITSLAVNALTMGLVGATSAVYTFKIFARFNKTLAVALAAWVFGCASRSRHCVRPGRATIDST